MPDPVVFEDAVDVVADCFGPFVLPLPVVPLVEPEGFFEPSAVETFGAFGSFVADLPLVGVGALAPEPFDPFGIGVVVGFLFGDFPLLLPGAEPELPGEDVALPEDFVRAAFDLAERVADTVARSRLRLTVDPEPVELVAVTVAADAPGRVGADIGPTIVAVATDAAVSPAATGAAACPATATIPYPASGIRLSHGRCTRKEMGPIP